MTQPLDYHTPVPKGSKLQVVAIVCAWIVGIELWFNTDWWLVRSGTHLSVYASAIAACFIKPIRELLLLIGRQLDRRGKLATPVVFVIASSIAIAILYATAIYSGRRFSPVFHDEFSYLLQAKMLSHGHLSMPAHPLGAFFDTFYIITDRAYASQYFPGAAMMFVPGVWLGFDGWVMPLIITGAAVGMIFLVIRELFDGLAGLAAIAIACSALEVRFQSLSPISQMPALLLGLTAAFCLLRWMRTRSLVYVVIAGLSIGWMAITRPLDAVAFAVVLAAFSAYSLYRSKAARTIWLRTMLAGIMPVIPFLAIQLTLNHRVTGDWFTTPFSYYAQRDLPGTSWGFKPFDADLRPASPLVQKQQFYVKNVQPMLREHEPVKVFKSWFGERAKGAIGEMYGDMLLLIPLPVALLMLRDPRRWMIVLIMPVWCALYSFYAFRYVHYYVVLIPSALVLTLAGFESLVRLTSRVGPIVSPLRAVLCSAIAVMSMPQFKSDVRDQIFDNFIEDDFRAQLAKLPDRSIVLIRFGPLSVPEWELVYNLDVAWPDDARVIRAHDLGSEKNRELYRYYANAQPDRTVYLYDRASDTFTRLGNVRELAETSGTKRDSIPVERPAAPETVTTQPASQP